jgi:hypothetical protein
MNQLVSHLVVAKDDKSTLFAAEGMLEGETGITTIALSGKTGWCDAILHRYGISELLG